MSAKRNFYDILGLPRDATLEEIRRAHRDLALQYHPDINPDPSSNELFLEIQRAFETLSDSQSREAYNRRLEEENTDPVNIGIIYSRPNLAILSEAQMLYALIEFSATKKYKTLPNPALNVCLVLDHSTSMQGVRMDTVKTAAIEIVRQMKPEDIFSLVVFSDRADVLVPASQRMSRSSIETQIQMVRASGGTEIFQGLSAAFSEIRRNLTRSMINHIILITDGRTYGDEANCMKLADVAAIQGVRITGLGIGTEWNDVFMDELTARTGGSSFYISRANDIRTLLQEKFASLNQIFAERVALELKLGENVNLSAAYRLQPEPGILQNNTPIRLGSIPKQDKLSVLLEFVIPSIPAETSRFSVASGEVSLLLPTEALRSYKIPFLLSRLASEEVSTALPPRPIFQALSQITLYRMQDRARQEVAEGKVQEASLRLQRLATQLLSLGEVELAQTAIIEAERIQQTHMLSAEGEKRIKYGTRAFMLPARVGEAEKP
jgi:Ca-activated chloride channel family protein